MGVGHLVAERRGPEPVAEAIGHLQAQAGERDERLGLADRPGPLVVLEGPALDGEGDRVQRRHPHPVGGGVLVDPPPRCRGRRAGRPRSPSARWARVAMWSGSNATLVKVRGLTVITVIPPWCRSAGRGVRRRVGTGTGTGTGTVCTVCTVDVERADRVRSNHAPRPPGSVPPAWPGGRPAPLDLLGGVEQGLDDHLALLPLLEVVAEAEVDRPYRRGVGDLAGCCSGGRCRRRSAGAAAPGTGRPASRW